MAPYPEVIEKLEFLGPDGKWFKNPGFRTNLTTPEGQAEIRKSLDRLLIRDVLVQFERADPTATKRYVPWLVQSYILDVFTTFEDVFGAKKFLKQFEELRRRKRLPEGVPTDLRQIKDNNTYAEAYDKVDDAFDEIDSPKNLPKGNANVLVDNQEVTVIRPLDYEASCYYGYKTQWCTADTESREMFDIYTRPDDDASPWDDEVLDNDGKLFIFIPKSPNPKKEKYQLYFKYETMRQNYQLMDYKDKPVDLKALMNRFKSLPLEFWQKLDPPTSNNLIILQPEQFKKLANDTATVVENHVWQILKDVQDNDVDYRAYLRSEGYFDEDALVYDWQRAYKDGHTYLDYDPDAKYAFNSVITDLKNLTAVEFDNFKPGRALHNSTINRIADWLESDEPHNRDKRSREMYGRVAAFIQDEMHGGNHFIGSDLTYFVGTKAELAQARNEAEK